MSIQKSKNIIGKLVEIPEYAHRHYPELKGDHRGVIVKVVMSRSPGSRGDFVAYVKLDALPKARAHRFILNDLREV